MQKQKPTTRIHERGRSVCVYFISEDEEMLQELSDLARTRKIPSISHFISAATRQLYAIKKKELEL